jgi:hypothetical protein
MVKYISAFCFLLFALALSAQPFKLRDPGFVGAVGNKATVAAIPTTGLYGWWKLSDASGTTAPDSSGNGFAGTITGSPSLTGVTINGVATSALTFTGSQYITLPVTGTNIFGDNTRAVSFWVYYTSTSAVYTAWMEGSVAARALWSMDFNQNSLDVYQAGDAGDNLQINYQTGTPTASLDSALQILGCWQRLSTDKQHWRAPGVERQLHLFAPRFLCASVVKFP